MAKRDFLTQTGITKKDRKEMLNWFTFFAMIPIHLVKDSIVFAENTTKFIQKKERNQKHCDSIVKRISIPTKNNSQAKLLPKIEWEITYTNYFKKSITYKNAKIFIQYNLIDNDANYKNAKVEIYFQLYFKYEPNSMFTSAPHLTKDLKNSVKLNFDNNIEMNNISLKVYDIAKKSYENFYKMTYNYEHTNPFNKDTNE